MRALAMHTLIRMTAFALLVLACLVPTSVWGKDYDPALDEYLYDAGHGHVSIFYQYIHVDGFEGGSGKVPIGTVDTHSLFFDFQYFLTDRLSVEAGIPLVRKRYNGTRVHDPLSLDPPRTDVPFIDDGSWNTDFQDLHLGLRYLAKTGPLQIEPFLLYGVPVQDYPHFGHAAVGQNLWKVEVGSTFTYIPHISDAWYRLDLGYVFVEETLDNSIDHWLIRAEAGYFFKPNLSGRLFLIHKDGDGLTSSRRDFPDRTTERWYQHDRMVMHNYSNLGAGLDWFVDEKYVLGASLMTQIRAEWVHIMEYSITLQMTRSF